MPRPIWTGAISFGLLNIPVQLMPAERRTDLKFHMLDARDNSRIRFERINAETGDEVPWKEIVKAFEFKKGSYVVLRDEDFKKAGSESKESVDIEAFVRASEIPPQYYEQPYFLVPQGKSDKGYVLLRETLTQLGTAGVARVVVRTREHLALLTAQGEALMLLLLRFPQELVDAEEYKFPATSKAKVTPKEREMAKQLVESMTEDWTPSKYHDHFRENLRKAIDARVKRKGGKEVAASEPPPRQESGKVVDFISLLQKSIQDKKRTPAAKSTSAAAKKNPARRKRA